MPTLTFNGESYSVDHAVKGPDYIHGYEANGMLLVSFEGIKNFDKYSYTGAYMSPSDCLEESCNDVKYCNGGFKTRGGDSLLPSGLGINDYVTEEGTKGIWSYRKWKSGKKECWGTYSATISHSASWNGGYEYLSGNINLPFTFDGSPVVTFHGRVTTGNSVPGYVGMTNSAISMMLWASASGSQHCTFCVHVIGK